MYRRLLPTLVLACCASAVAAFSSSFVSQKSVLSSSTGGWRRPTKRPVTSHGGLYMRDASASYWFKTGDSVRVVADDVEKAGYNLQNRVGTVVATWEKCDVDPTCCCAEQVDINMAVRVEFQGTEADPSVAGTSFQHYFGEAELIKVTKPEEAPKEDTLPFDGMNCVAFKMDQIQSASQAPRDFGRWEPEASSNQSEEKPSEPPKEDALPFDGMSCVAFKMDQIQSTSQAPRGFGRWEPEAASNQ